MKDLQMIEMMHLQLVFLSMDFHELIQHCPYNISNEIIRNINKKQVLKDEIATALAIYISQVKK